MTTTEKYRMALMQLKAYSDNDLVMFNSKSYSIEAELDGLNMDKYITKLGVLLC